MMQITEQPGLHGELKGPLATEQDSVSGNCKMKQILRHGGGSRCGSPTFVCVVQLVIFFPKRDIAPRMQNFISSSFCAKHCVRSSSGCNKRECWVGGHEITTFLVVEHPQEIVAYFYILSEKDALGCSAFNQHKCSRLSQAKENSLGQEAQSWRARESGLEMGEKSD